MSLGEFDIIQRYFANRGPVRRDVFTGIGDDAALLLTRDDKLLAVSTDTLIDGVHFPPDTDPRALGHRVLAVSLSDLAAMGAEPAWALLALTLPHANEHWLEAFADGLFTLAERFAVALVGGDLTRGPLSMTLQLQGHAPPMLALTRDAAAPGDEIYVTGTPGDAAAGLALIRRPPQAPTQAQATLIDRFLWPEPRVAEGLSLPGVASAAIDISDGLLSDAGKIGRMSGVSLRIDVARLPLSRALREAFDEEQARRFALGGGDDYELLFTMPPSRAARLEAARARWSCRCTRIGTVHAGKGASAWLDGRRVRAGNRGYRHF